MKASNQAQSETFAAEIIALEALLKAPVTPEIRKLARKRFLELTDKEFER